MKLILAAAVSALCLASSIGHAQEDDITQSLADNPSSTVQDIDRAFRLTESRTEERFSEISSTIQDLSRATKENLIFINHELEKLDMREKEGKTQPDNEK